MNSAYPLTHFLNSGNLEQLNLRCADAVRLDAFGYCRKCLLWDGEACTAKPETVCPFLEADPARYGRAARIKERRRRKC